MLTLPFSSGVRRAAFAACVMLLAAVRSAHGQGIPELALAKAETRCHQEIQRAGSSFASRRLAGLGACLDGIVQCVDARAGDRACLERRGAACRRTLTGLAGAEDRLVLRIAAACGAVGGGLLDSAGLGYGSLAGRCTDEFGSPLTDASAIARCIMRQHRCGTGQLLAAQEPRAAALVALAGASLGLDACPAETAPTDGEARDALSAGVAHAACERAARRAGRAFALARLTRLGECTHAIFACNRTAANDTPCLVGARQACDENLDALAQSAIRLAHSVDRACPALDADSLGSARPCALLGAGSGRLPSDAATCLLETDGCLVDDLLLFESPHNEALLTQVGLDASTLCALPPPPVPSDQSTKAATPLPFAFTPARTPGPTRSATPTRSRTPTPSRSPTPTVTPTPPIVQALAIDPAIPVTLYAATNGGGVFKSTSAGTSWTPYNAGLTTTTVNALAVDPRTPAILYAGTDGGGVFKSTSAGASWTPSSGGLTTPAVRALAIDPDTPAIVFAGTGGGGVFRSVDGGTSWTPVNGGLTNLDVTAVALDPKTPTAVYVGTAGGGVFKSTTGGTTWTATSLAPSFVDAGVVRSLAVDPATPTTVYVGTNDGGVFKSTSGGATWTQTALAASFASAASVRALALDPATPTTLYAGTNRGGVFKSTNGGATWTPTSLAGSFANATSVRTLAIDPKSTATLYAGTRGGGVFKSSDGGTSWTTARSGLPIS